MKIIDKLRQGRPMISVEVFPAKKDSDMAPVLAAVDEIAALNPAFISVTYGAAGKTACNTLKTAAHITNDLRQSALAHMTCVTSTPEDVTAYLRQCREQHIENVLALRGDIPAEGNFPIPGGFRYASELVAHIRKIDSDICIGGACYPEGHVECEHKADDIAHLKKKVESGCDFLTTQMFFDNNILYNFLYRIREQGITVPVIAGIMPVTNGKQIKRTCALSGTYLPARFKAIVDRFGDDPAAMRQAGIAYATEQIIDLMANGVNAVHIYSMNKPYVAQQICRNLSDIIGRDA